MTPLDCALQRGFRSTAKYLQLHGGVPAIRLGDPRNQLVSVQPKEDVMFWGDSSSASDEENVDLQKNKKKHPRKKHSQKYERKILSLSSSEKEMQTQKLISDEKKATRMDQKKNGQEKPEDGGDETHLNEEIKPFVEASTREVRPSSTDRDKRPRSAKYSKLKTSTTSSVSEKELEGLTEGVSQRLEEEAQASIQATHSRDTNTSEDTGETVVANKQMSVDQLVQSNLQDQQSIVSLTSEETDEHKTEMVVEASIHPPPQCPDLNPDAVEETEDITDDANKEDVVEDQSEAQKGRTKEETLEQIDGNVGDLQGKPVDIDAPSKNNSLVIEDKIEELAVQQSDVLPQVEPKDNDVVVEDEDLNEKEGNGQSEDDENVLVDKQSDDQVESPHEISENIDFIEEKSASENADVSNLKHEEEECEISEISPGEEDPVTGDVQKTSELEIPKPTKRLVKQKSQRKTDSEEKDQSPVLDTPHKSFRVLNEEEAEKMEKISQKRSRKRSVPKKLRSYSDETKDKERTVKQKKMRSKIPTPLFKSNLSKSDKYLDKPYDQNKMGVAFDAQIPSLPTIGDDKRILKESIRCESNMSAPPVASMFSDNERDSLTDPDDLHHKMGKSKRFVKRRSRNREARSAGSDYESSNLIDSGFEPSPRTTKIPRWKNMSERGVNMTSVTQGIQNNIRR